MSDQEQQESRATLVFRHPIILPVPVMSDPDQDRVWIIEYPHNNEWWFWPDICPITKYSVEASTFEMCWKRVCSFRDAPAVFPMVPIHQWRIRNVTNEEEVMYVGLLL